MRRTILGWAVGKYHRAVIIVMQNRWHPGFLIYMGSGPGMVSTIKRRNRAGGSHSRGTEKRKNRGEESKYFAAR